jgi:adenine/guanine phosphoribosyltransferase-like PRPP-binding protein
MLTSTARSVPRRPSATERPQLPLAPHEFWQDIHSAGTFDAVPSNGFRDLYPAVLPDGRQVTLPIRILPSGKQAVASLIVNQASFVVEDALAEAMTELARPFTADIIIGIPTLGLPLANGVARRLGHRRMVSLGTSRKFWYRDELSEPLSSITSPDHAKRVFLDPRLLPLLENRRVIVVDDVISSGASMTAVLRLLGRIGIKPVAAVFAMTQGERWRDALADLDRTLPTLVFSAIASPIFAVTPEGLWRPELSVQDI